MKKMFFILSMLSMLLGSVTYAGLHFGIKRAVKKQTKKVDVKAREEKTNQEVIQGNTEELQKVREELQEAEQEKASGNANAEDVKAGKTFSKTGQAGLTGTMPTQTLSAANETVSAGYYAATTLSAVEADLVVGNIKDGVTIFGVDGTLSGHELPDTGQHKFYNNTVEISSPSAGKAFYGQDAHYNPTASLPSYTDNGDTVTDDITGLMWAKAGDGAGGSNGNTMTWEVALSSCEALSFATYDDWRLPNVRELMSIVDYGSSPAVDGTYFPNTVSDYYWTSTTYVPNTTYAWVVHFGIGDVSGNLKTNNRYVRAVRGGP